MEESAIRKVLDTPVMEQYQACKKQFPDAILFFRLGDFYEMFFDDAITASEILGLTLTSRHKEAGIPMAGVPYHSAEGYIRKLLDAGKKVALCEQMEKPDKKKKMIAREVVRIFTPGTVVEETVLDETRPNYLLAVTERNGRCALVWSDVSCGDVFYAVTDMTRLPDTARTIAPAEIIASRVIPEIGAHPPEMETASRRSLSSHATSYLSKGDGTFTIAPYHEFFAVYLDPVAGAAFLDYDRDGNLDIYVGHHYGKYGYPVTAEQDTLHKGNGKGKFTNVTDSAKLTTLKATDETIKAGTNHKPTWGVTACDVDGDGWTDLMSTTYGRGFNMFWRNKGDGTFEDLSLSSKFAADDNLDYSDDQWYLCYCATHSDTGDYCANAASPMISCSGLENAWEPGVSDHPSRLGGNSSATVCADLDNDGDLDLLGVELAHWHIGQASDKTEILRNDGFPQTPFFRPGRTATGLDRPHPPANWDEGDLGALAGDLDNDGRIDLYILSSDYPGTYALLFQQQKDGRFEEVGSEAGARVIRAHGGALFDYDRDGDYDLLVGSSLMRWSSTDVPPAPSQPWVTLLRNETGQNANRLLLLVEGAGAPDGANRMAIGARVTVAAGGKVFVREIQGGYGLFGFQNDPLLIIGLGESCVAEEVVVKWPNKKGSISKFNNVRANYLVRIHETEGLTYQRLENFVTHLRLRAK